jgi:hypothetical protein
MSRLIQAAHIHPAGGAACAALVDDAPVWLDEPSVHADIIEAAASASKHARANSNPRDRISPPVGAPTIGIVGIELGKHTLMDLRRRLEFRELAALRGLPRHRRHNRRSDARSERATRQGG